MKVFSFKLKNIIITAAVILAVAAGVFFFAHNATDAVSAEERLVPIYRVNTDENKVSVTFNCANGNGDIDKILSVLEGYDIKCTFFVLGSWAEKNGEYVKKIHEAGHEIGNHSNSHRDPANMKKSEITADIAKCNGIVKLFTGTVPTLYRAPSGSYSNAAIKAAEGLNMKTIQWDCDSVDWKNNSAEEIIKKSTKNLKSGSILQFHTGTAHTAEALPKVLDIINNKNLSCVTVSELIYKTNYKINSKGEQILCEISEEYSTN